MEDTATLSTGDSAIFVQGGNQGIGTMRIRQEIRIYMPWVLKPISDGPQGASCNPEIQGGSTAVDT